MRFAVLRDVLKSVQVIPTLKVHNYVSGHRRVKTAACLVRHHVQADGLEPDS